MNEFGMHKHACESARVHAYTQTTITHVHTPTCTYNIVHAHLPTRTHTHAHTRNTRTHAVRISYTHARTHTHTGIIKRCLNTNAHDAHQKCIYVFKHWVFAYVCMYIYEYIDSYVEHIELPAKLRLHLCACVTL